MVLYLCSTPYIFSEYLQTMLVLQKGKRDNTSHGGRAPDYNYFGNRYMRPQQWLLLHHSNNPRSNTSFIIHPFL